MSINQSGDVQLKRARAEGLQEDHPHQQTVLLSVDGLQEVYGADDQPHIGAKGFFRFILRYF